MKPQIKPPGVANVVFFGRDPDRRDPTSRTFRDTAHVIEALAPDYPVYCFSRRVLREQADRFLLEFPGEIAYAVKANAASVVVSALADAGVNCFDVASISEIELIRRLAPAARLLYDNPVKSREEIERAYLELGVTSFALDDSAELDKLLAIAGADPGVQSTVRFKLPKVMPAQDLSSKFGATQDEAVNLLRKAAAAGFAPALTFHPGSQCRDPQAYVEYIEAAAGIAAKARVELSMLNVGGGFPAPYLNSAVPPLAEYFHAIGDAFRLNFNTERTQLVCEPGRALVAQCASLLCRVKHRRGGCTIFLNDGIYGGLLEQFMFKLSMPVRAFRGPRELQGEACEFEVFGPTCDSTDRLPLAVNLPGRIAEGDWIEFALMGAYGSVTSTRFNGFSSDRYVEVLNGFELRGQYT